MTEAQPPDLPALRDFIRDRRAALFGFMANGAALALDGDVLTIIPRGDIYIRYLNDNRSAIADLASEFFGRPINAVVWPPGAALAASNGARPHPTAQAAPASQPELKRAPQPHPAEIPPVHSSVEGIKRTIQILHPDPRDIIEIRVLGTDGKVSGAGFYDRDHIDKAAKTAAAQDAKGVYIVLNQGHPGLLALAPNQFLEKIRKTTADEDITWRTWLLIDFDPKRPGGIAATDEEKAASYEVAMACLKWLTDHGWAQPIIGDSGNGYHLLYRIDLPNDVATRDLIKQVLLNLAARFNTSLVTVDPGNFNAARIDKLYGTAVRKGFNLLDRPHRLSKIIAVDGVETISLEQLKAVGTKPEGARKVNESTHRSTGDASGSAPLTDIEEALKFIDAGPRDNWLHVGWALKSELGEAGKSIWDRWSQGSGKFNQEDQDATWNKSKDDGGIKLGTLFKLARDAGWSGSKSLQVLHKGTPLAVRDNAMPERIEAQGEPSGLVTLNIEELLQRQSEPREFVLEPVVKVKDLAMIYSWRGVGKTLAALEMAYAMAAGGKCLKWQAPRPARVLYIDGELPLEVIKERVARLAVAHDKEPEADFLQFITPDVQERPIPNLSDPKAQMMVDEIIADKKIEVLFIDSISTLCRAGRENEAESWLPIQEWALRLRRRGVTVIFVHHAGKGGAQRGTSRREDILDTVIHLVHPTDYRPEEGSRFEVHFEKTRALWGDALRPFEAKLEIINGVTTWTMRDVEDLNHSRAMELFDEGMSVRNVAEVLGISKSAAERLKIKLKKEAKK